MQSRIEYFKSRVYDEYESVERATVSELVTDLCHIIDDTEIELVELFFMLTEFEERTGAPRADEFYLLDNLLYCLEDNKANADRLYDFTVNNAEWWPVMNKLLRYNDEYLTDEQIENLIPIVEGYEFYWLPETREWVWRPDGREEMPL